MSQAEVAGPVSPNPTPVQTNDPAADADAVARLKAYAQEATLTGKVTPDPAFASTFERIIEMINRRPTQAPWRRMFSGSGDNQGWSIYAGTELVAYLGGDDSQGEAVDALIQAHNKALGYVA